MKYADDQDRIEIDSATYEAWLREQQNSRRIAAILATIHAYPDKIASECIELFYLNGLTLNEIAQAMKNKPDFAGLNQKQRVEKIRYKIKVALKRMRAQCTRAI